MTDAPRPKGSLKLDVASAYCLTATRMMSWLVVAGVVYRHAVTGSFAMLALMRSTVGLLTYVGFGIGPALIHVLAQHQAAEARLAAAASRGGGAGRLAEETKEKSYSSGQIAISHAIFLVLCLAAIGLVALFVYTGAIPRLHALPRFPPVWVIERFTLWYGIGMLLRILSDPAGAALQFHGRIAADNLLQCAADAAWATIVVLMDIHNGGLSLQVVGQAYAISSIALLVARSIYCWRVVEGIPLRAERLHWPVMLGLAAFGAMVTVGQLADFLYAPTDYILINRMLDPLLVTVYAPAVQVDATLLLAVTALAAVILPRAAAEHARGDGAAVRRYYVRGTLASIGLLAPGAVVAWLVSPWAFRLWLHDPMPATQAILPLVLVHTVVGGSSSVGRSILLAIGRVQAHTVAVLVSGVTNVILSFVFVRYCHLGLRGIILGTIVAVVGRCAIWMPWYVTRVLRRPNDLDEDGGFAMAPGGPL